MGFTPDGEYPVINGEKGLVNEGYTCKFTQSGALRLKKLVGGTAHNIVPHHAFADFACDAALAQEIAAKTAEGVTVTLMDDGFTVAAEGVSAHGGTPWEGVNANGRLVQFLAKLPLEGQLKTAIDFLAEKIGMEWDGTSMGIAMSDEVSGQLTNNFGVLNADESTMEVKLNYRYPVTKTYDMCGPQLMAAFEAAGFRLTAATRKNRLYMAPDSELVQRLMKVYTECTGDLDAQPKSIGGGTYAKMLPNVLAFGPIFPGDEVREHKPDEFMELSRLQDNVNILAEAMYALAAN
jgi:succinyl-diaminopimelate desuccinylase